MLTWVVAVLAAVATVLVLVGTEGEAWDLAAGLGVVGVAGAVAGLELALRVRAGAARARELLSHISRGIPDALFELAPDGTFRLVTQASGRLVGVPSKELRGRKITEFTDTDLPEMRPYETTRTMWETHWRMPGGALQPVTIAVEPVWASDGRLEAVRGVIRDHSDRAATERALRQSEARFRRVIDAAQNGLILASMDGRLLLVNDALRDLLGYTPADIAERTLADLTDPTDVDQLMALMGACLWADGASNHYEMQLVTSAGTNVEVEVSLAALREGDDATSVLIEVRDLTDARRTSSVIRQMVEYDRLTGLPNRELFDRHLQRALIDARAEGSHVAVILLDLDRFKLINDTLGHPSGDRLLKAVGERLRAHLPPRWVVARFSGDEYIVLCPGISGVAAAETEARRVMGAFRQAFDHDGMRLQVAATAGVAVYPAHAIDGDTLVRIADAALHQAKADGGDTHRMGSDDADDPSRRRLELEADLRQAVERDELSVHYQPQVDPRTGELAALEALLRWRHPVRGPVSPGEFVPLLEDTGLIVPVGQMVLREACRRARAWRDAGRPHLRITVNVSPRQFVGASLEEGIVAALQEADLPAEALEIELTETAGLLDFESVVEVIERLVKVGVSTAIDDFGIGQSWFGRLRRFPIRTLKVDRSFIQRTATSANDLAIVQAVVALGHALGMSVVAEGVEDREQLDVVTAIGCDLVQGHYYSAAVPAEEITAMLARRFDALAA